MNEQTVKNIKDPSIGDWLIPKFTTTTENDCIVASVSTMVTLQSYFEYKLLSHDGPEATRVCGYLII